EKGWFLLGCSAAVLAEFWVVCCAVGLSLQEMRSFLRACCACHQESATIATPQCRPRRSCVPSIMKACLMPGRARTSSMLAEAILLAKTGHFSKTAYSIPGTLKSMEYGNFPVTMNGLSTLRVGLPMIL